MFYRLLVRPALYALSAETAHHLVMRWLSILSRIKPLCALLAAALAPRDPSLRVSALGLTFPSPIGLAAGLDKDGIAVPALCALGFGCVEVGTITAQPQPGNPRPRLFRLLRDRALVNRMGFNNRGAADARARLSRLPRQRAPLGINIGKTKLVENANALEDYAQSAAQLGPYADYLVINVSSPSATRSCCAPGVRSTSTTAARWTATVSSTCPGSAASRWPA